MYLPSFTPLYELNLHVMLSKLLSYHAFLLVLTVLLVSISSQAPLPNFSRLYSLCTNLIKYSDYSPDRCLFSTLDFIKPNSLPLFLQIMQNCTSPQTRYTEVHIPCTFAPISVPNCSSGQESSGDGLFQEGK